MFLPPEVRGGVNLIGRIPFWHTFCLWGAFTSLTRVEISFLVWFAAFPRAAICISELACFFRFYSCSWKPRQQTGPHLSPTFSRGAFLDEHISVRFTACRQLCIFSDSKIHFFPHFLDNLGSTWQPNSDLLTCVQTFNLWPNMLNTFSQPLLFHLTPVLIPASVFICRLL